MKREEFKYFPPVIYFNNRNEFDNKIFTDPTKVSFKVQFTIDRRIAVYVERAIRTIRQSLEQYYIGRINENPSNYKDVFTKHGRKSQQFSLISCTTCQKPKWDKSKCEPQGRH